MARTKQHSDSTENELEKATFPKTVQSGIPRLGPLPQGWSRGPLSQHLKEERRPVAMDNDIDYNLVTVKRARGGVVSRERLKGHEISVKTQFRVHSGDFLISKRQIVHGACGIVPPELDGATVSNEYAVLHADDSINLNFLNYLAHSIYFQQTCFHSSIGVHVEKMIFRLERWLNWDFDLPPLTEQNRIAEILFVWDRAIENAERLLANTEKLRNGLMRQFFMGEKRLPGHSGKWRTVSLAELGTTYGGLTGKTKTDFGSGSFYVPYKNVFENPFVDEGHLDLVQIALSENQNKVLRGDILFTTSSETPDEVGMTSVVMFDKPALYLNSFCFGFRPHSVDALIPSFAAYYFRSAEMRLLISSLAQGSTRYNISKRALLNKKFQLPNPNEQRALAEFFGVIHQQIEKLKINLNALRQEKSALMQQLLTGKRRVKIDKEQAA